MFYSNVLKELYAIRKKKISLLYKKKVKKGDGFFFLMGRASQVRHFTGYFPDLRIAIVYKISQNFSSLRVGDLPQGKSCGCPDLGIPPGTTKNRAFLDQDLRERLYTRWAPYLSQRLATGDQ
jgi:hypothetical protein